MRITKKQLKRIIKEERTRLLKEAQARSLNEGSLQGAEERFALALEEYVQALDESMGYDVPNVDLKAEVMNQVDGHFEFLEDYEKNPGMYGGKS